MTTAPSSPLPAPQSPAPDDDCENGNDDGHDTSPLRRALGHKCEGNALFSGGRYADSARAYLRGLAELRWPPTDTANDGEDGHGRDSSSSVPAAAGGEEVGGGSSSTTSSTAAAGAAIGPSESSEPVTGATTTTSTVQRGTGDGGTCTTTIPIHPHRTPHPGGEKMNLVSKSDAGDTNSNSPPSSPSPPSPLSPTATEATTRKEERDEAARLRSNLALCYLRLGRYPLSEHESTLALRLLLEDEKDSDGGGHGGAREGESEREWASRVAKVYYRRASAREKLDRYADAEDDVRRCLDLLLGGSKSGVGFTKAAVGATATATATSGDAGMVKAARDALRRIGRLRTGSNSNEEAVESKKVGKIPVTARVESGSPSRRDDGAGEGTVAAGEEEEDPVAAPTSTSTPTPTPTRPIVGGASAGGKAPATAAAEGRGGMADSRQQTANTDHDASSEVVNDRGGRPSVSSGGTTRPAHDAAGGTTDEDRRHRHQPSMAQPQAPRPRPQPKAPDPPPSRCPPPEKQLEIVRTLLAQSRGIRNSENGVIHSRSGMGGYHVGEAYFVLDHRWWTRWCDHVRFLHGGGSGGGGCGEDKGAGGGVGGGGVKAVQKEEEGNGNTTDRDGEDITDTEEEESDGDADSSLSTTTSTSSSSSSEEHDGGPPGVIDNTHLVLPREEDGTVPTGGDGEASDEAASDDGASDEDDGGGEEVMAEEDKSSHFHDEEKKDESPPHGAAASSSSSSDDDDPFSEWRHGSPSRNLPLATPTRAVASRHVSSPRRYVRLRPNLVRGYHYEILPREVYAALRSWYGEVGPSICRRTELMTSTGTTTMTTAATASAGGDGSTSAIGVRLYPELQHASSSSSSSSHSATTTSLTTETATVAAATADVTVAVAAGGHCGTCHAPATKRCTRCLSVFYCGRTCQVSHFPYHKGHCRVRAAKNRRTDTPSVVASSSSSSTTSTSVTSSSSSSSSVLRSRWGRCGLGNLGNTCFMNSAIQCLSHVAPLTKFFLTNRFQRDINRSNPLGTGGCLALSYDATVKELWLGLAAGSGGGGGGGGGGGSCITPSQLKRAISTFAPRFAGCSQHDAQEFLAYLLDGLHEDLNRVRDAPYVEMPDAGDGRNLRIAAAEAWDLYGRRNDSFVVDTFYGQFKSTCVCPDCGKVSVSFDAFNNISLELPQYNLRTMAVVLFRNNDSVEKWGEEPTRFALTLNRNGCMRDVRVALSELCGINVDRLVLADIYESSIYELYPDNKRLSTVRVEDVIAAYEVDPFPSPTIHAIVTHVTKGQADAIDGDALIKIGFPLLTSFDSSLTCGQIREHLWRQVRRCVVGEEPQSEHHNDGATEEEWPQSQSSRTDAAGGPANSLRVRVTDQNGNPVPMFASHDAESSAMDTSTTEEEDYDGDDARNDGTTRLPDDPAALPCSDLKLADILGPECTDRYLFLSIEWVDTFTFGKNEGTTVRLSANRFNEFVDHCSVLETRRRAGQGNSITLDQCFEAFTRPERLDEHNMWYCSNCREHVRAMKTMELWKLPNVLVVHLKRFDHKHGFRRDKLETFVDFPTDGLDMSRHCSSYRRNVDPGSVKVDGAVESLDSIHEASFVCDEIPAVYDLFAVTNHYGRMGFGHYTAFARRWDATGIEKEWALFDDSSVRSVVGGTGSGGGSAVVTPAAYVLFYRRRLFT